MNGDVGDKYHEDAQMLIVTKVCKRDVLFPWEWTSNPHPMDWRKSDYVAHIIYEVNALFYLDVEYGSPNFWWSWRFDDGQAQAWPNETMHATFFEFCRALNVVFCNFK